MKLPQLESRRVQAIMELCSNAAQGVPTDKSQWKPEGLGKSVHEILEHLAGANHGFAALIRGGALSETAKKSVDRQSIKNPAASYPHAVEALRESGQALAEAIASVPDEQLRQERPMPWGETWAVTRLLTAPSAHIAYHWGQICYLQTLWGDQEDRF
ncbi:MAG: hypothetical protein A2Z21_06300 [Candidatus Fraserbacteria bacterium RBG_16_55_9]|uniref:DinB-like domain-containing protein n=1 Tax=Fraserbacteria sp. (strain RBG_16_55_9) TaxID=1817864 RepID=A0A1F5V055_FRAXR|nr:MAG: hypothetical protein A2Z21_06300 [Candidatus Fraserbacteria bacterium RBG_16_55_9]